DKLVRLLFFIGSLKDAGASRVTAVLPYLCYARKDRKTKSRDPVSTRYLASLFEAVGTDRVLTLDVHNLAAYQNAFRVPTEHLEAKRLFVAHCASIDGPVSVLSPDVGGVKRAEAFREALRSRLDRDVDLAFMEKYRSAGVVSGGTLVGTVQNHTVLILDDLIASGGTLVRAARACRERGATRVIAMATHGAFSANAERVLDDTAIDSLVITDSIPVHRTRAESLRQRLVVLDTAELFAESIRRMHSGGSIVELLEG
ncbi:MAG: ribose-phosphate pyrophosphokinase, partial [Gammaproteobacteria bacterium]|nr:ribose-phosphate pyrophosphokinase [Gammaproteobacteria bacterium]